ncbi:MAG: hypothetical protein KZQ99_02965 [Candidatus Thiodiazotropha sp. (ex Dulcina madagascariensis)]|nr:hypothetical protein [Candidatus Thiodiazotropha sp. (ex Dulcina madagascariensis)]
MVGNELQTAGFDANHYKPEFQSHDRFGHRYDGELNAFKQSLMTKNNNEHILRRQVEKMALLCLQ